MPDTRFTPGPWQWRQMGIGEWYLCAPHSGILTVMDFVRHKMQLAQPRFSDRDGTRKGGFMHKASDMDVRSHPDAALIAASPEMYAMLEDCAAYLRGVIEPVKGVGMENEVGLLNQIECTLEAARGEVSP